MTRTHFFERAMLTMWLFLNTYAQLPDSNCSFPERSSSTTCTLPFSFPCHNGDCVLGWVFKGDGSADLIHVCRCDPGWAGHSCDQCCDLPCTPNHGVCKLEEHSGEPYCECTDGFVGEDCSVDAQTVTWGMGTSEASIEATVTEAPTFCNGILVDDDKYTDCYGQYCYHGKCVVYNDTNLGDGINSNCECDPGWTGSKCDICCDLPCFNSTCVHHRGGGNVTRYCECDDPDYMYTEDSNCTKRRPEDIVTFVVTATVTVVERTNPGWLWYVVGVGVAQICLLFLLLILLPYYMWKKRHLLMMKIVYRFQKYENPSDYDYDVFISYKDVDDDERFVLRELLPKLEKEMRLKTCLLVRDSIPGASIGDTIISAIEKSSRSILVISPEYCKGDWSGFEYQVAQAESLKQRHRIIPIIYKDIKDFPLDHLLSYIVGSAKKLQWPEKKEERVVSKFWTKLHLMMPKYKRQSESGEIVGYSRQEDHIGMQPHVDRFSEEVEISQEPQPNSLYLRSIETKEHGQSLDVPSVTLDLSSSKEVCTSIGSADSAYESMNI